jgi:hypothetical protein
MHRLTGASAATRNDECRMRRPAVFVGCSDGNELEPLTVSRKPTALSDARLYELCGLTEEEIRVLERTEE